MSHTPGPWKVNATPHSSNQSFVVLDSGANGHSKRVCAVYSDNEEADARLIAAAPEMYELFKELIDIEKGPCPGSSTWAKRVYAVLAKAEGK